MKRMLSIVGVVGILFMGFMAHASAPEYIPVQGVLTDAEGNAVEGSVSVQFALYDADDATTALWSEVQNVTVTEGVFSVYLGMVQSFEAGMFVDNGNLWLGITVGSDEEMARVYLGSAPYARYAEHVGNVPDHGHGLDEITGTEAVVSGPQSCEDGYVAAGIDDAGVLVCVEETDTLYDGSSFALSGNNCPDGEVLYGIDAGGLPLCRSDATNVYDGTSFALSGNNCPDGEVLIGIDAGGLPLCQADATVEYDGTDFALSGNACPVGEVLAGIDSDGLPLCQVDATVEYDGTDFALSSVACGLGEVMYGVDADGNPLCISDVSNTYTAAEGMGLELAENAFGLMSTCEHGEVLKWEVIEGGGQWVCAPDENVTYDGGNFALSGQACPAGQVMTGVDAAGIPVCAVDADTTYDGGTFALSAQACPPGEKVVGINPDGTVSCDVDLNDDTTYDGSTFALSSQACPPGQMMTGVDEAGLPACATDADTTYDGSNFALSSQACPAGEKVVGINPDGTVSCDVDLNDDTTYDGSDFALSAQACPPGQVVTGVNSVGLPVCAADTDTTYDGGDFALSGQGCPAGQKVVGINPDGTVNCDVDIDNNTTYDGTDFATSGQGCPPGMKVTGINADGSVSCDVDIDNNTTYDGSDFATSGQTCVPGMKVAGINADGTVFCLPDTNTTYSAGTGLSLSGSTFSVNAAAVQSRVSGTCPTGQAIRVINSNGTVTCQEASGGSSGGADVVYGDGSNGVLTISSPTTWNDSTEANMGRQYTDVNVNANWVVPSGTVIRCTGNFNVAAGATITVSHGAPPADPNTYVILRGLALSPTTSGADPGLKLPKTMAVEMVNPGPLGGGAGSYGTEAFGGGGNGSFSVRCKGTITINGTLRSNGGNGGNGVQGNGAGGGAGGFIVLASQTQVHIPSPGQVQAIGGNGGNGTQSSTGRARSGGSGGGGGVIYLLAPSIGSWNVLLNGGTPGTGAGGTATTTDGEAGGSMGGTGGAGGVDAGPGNGGQPGYLIRKTMAHPENLFF